MKNAHYYSLLILALLSTPLTPLAANPALETLNKKLATSYHAKPVAQKSIPLVDRMIDIPHPLVIRDWPTVSRKYYQLVLSKPDTQIGGRPLLTAKAQTKGSGKNFANGFYPLSAEHVTSKSGQKGWNFSFYDNNAFKGTPKATRIDTLINFQWKKESPLQGQVKDHFTIRWSGTLTAPETRTYEIIAQSDDGSRVLIDGKALIDNLKATHKTKARIDLEKGQTYDLIVEYREGSGDATMILNWDYLSPQSLASLKARETFDFKVPTYLGSKLDNEIFACLSPVVGAKMMDLNPNALVGFDILKSAKSWYDEKHGVYRHRPNDRSANFHSGIYGYWSSVYGVMLAHLYPLDPDFQKHHHTATNTFLTIAKGLGAPHNPDFNNLGFNFDTNGPGGRNEPMNKLGNAPIIAWMLLMGYDLHHNPEMLTCAQATLDWYSQNLGRYELTHVMAPYVAARLNAEHGGTFDLAPLYDAWFGELPGGWHITSGQILDDGLTADGLDGAIRRKHNSFLCFTMGTLNGPTWLLPALRYDQSYAKAIAKYALNMAVSTRYLQGHGLDWNHQDHKDWKDQHDPDNLLFYEAIDKHSIDPKKTYSPNATGDPIKLNWIKRLTEEHGEFNRKTFLEDKKKWISQESANFGMYMGNHISLLGAICQPTDVNGIIRWDCLATEWHHPKAYPTYLYHNPFQEKKTITLKLPETVDLYDTISRTFLAKGVKSGDQLTLQPDQATVIVCLPENAKLTQKSGKLYANNIIIDHKNTQQ